jgi:hypothetical protein
MISNTAFSRRPSLLLLGQAFILSELLHEETLTSLTSTSYLVIKAERVGDRSTLDTQNTDLITDLLLKNAFYKWSSRRNKPN